MCECIDCVTATAIANLIKVGLAVDEVQACELLNTVVPIHTNKKDVHARMKLLAGVHGYAVYKMLLARSSFHG